VIIPAYNEEDRINDTIRALQEIKGVIPIEIIVVDAESGPHAGSTAACIEDKGVITLSASKGRACQMNKGAWAASGDTLLFLHADTHLPENGLQRISETMASGKYVGGAFSHNTRGRHWFVKHLLYTSYLRSLVSRVPYGDQAIFVDRRYFEKLGGYKEIPIMEEVDLMKRIKQNQDKIRILKEGVRTSSRRYEEEGMVFGWLRNHKVRFLYHLGKPPEQLTRYYPDTRRKKRP